MCIININYAYILKLLYIKLVDNMHILITYVGRSIGSTWVAYDQVRHEVGPIDRTYILCSSFINEDTGKRSCDLAHEAAKRIYKSENPDDDYFDSPGYDVEKSNDYGGCVSTIFLNKSENFDYNFVHDLLIRIYTENNRPKITMNVTNGNGKTKCAMCIAAFEIGASIYYVNHPGDGSDHIEKIIDCNAPDYDNLGKTEKKILWAIKEMEEVRLSNRMNYNAKQDSGQVHKHGKRSAISLGEITRATISQHTIDSHWPNPISQQSLTKPVKTLEHKGLVKLVPLNDKETRIDLTAKGRIVLSKIDRRPL